MDFEDHSSWSREERRSAAKAARAAAKMGRGRARASVNQGGWSRAGKLQACTYKGLKGGRAGVKYAARAADARFCCSSMIARDPAGWLRELDAIAARRPGLKDPNFHFVLAFNPLSSKKSPEFLEAFVRSMLRKMGFVEGCEFVAIEHAKGTQHLHVITSRVHVRPDGGTESVVSLSHGHRRFRQCLRDTEREFGLRTIDITPTDRLAQNDIQIRVQKRAQRLGQTPNFLDAHVILQCLAESPSFQIFSDKLSEKGIRVKPAERRTDGASVSAGILFQRAGAQDWLAGSSISRECSLPNIRRQIELNAACLREQRLAQQRQVIDQQRITQQAQQTQYHPRER